MLPLVTLCWVQDGILLMLASGLSMITIDSLDSWANRKNVILKLTVCEGTA
ncbi:hypothetical protein RO3G_08947 [Rhizopus delemar RA 99-880]|uniref:Uncharacterized protein n=1 Tax=Rhizopus delemar (strain RA 99-880 / ATCC MYA-4621 / FGSC 9543 / NRRL 43880) TaxID=246409 RepID=I1C707_RHIO9|nr:hypothetical protein RO3G_08947 [Rhizopus delemar RA 99-880]|eukprot:EIE84237.1 hypothetical protein RO3G_08947 [Rhizopus delemar RA 99-880]